MVFVTVGTPTQDFSRLLQGVDRLAGYGFFAGERIVVQTGSSHRFLPRHCEWTAFFPRDEFDRYLREASLVISHGGSTLLDLVRLGRVPVAMARRKKYGEHVNDHQLELVGALAAAGYVVAAPECEDLADGIDDARRLVAPALSRGQMVSLVRRAVEELMGETGREVGNEAIWHEGVKPEE